MALKYAILGLLHYQDMHGYQIKKHIEQNFGAMWSVNFGQIYPNLRKLEKEGLVTLKEETPGQGGPRRKLYAITDQGRENFATWLAQPPERDLLLRDPFLTRLVFCGFGDPAQALELLDGQIERYEAELERRRANQARWAKHNVYVRGVARLGLDFNKMFLLWLKSTREEVIRERTERSGG